VPGEVRYSFKRVTVEDLTVANKTFLAKGNAYQEWDVNW
jgi:hypothetical protein